MDKHGFFKSRHEEGTRDVRLVVLDVVNLCAKGVRRRAQRGRERVLDAAHLGDVGQSVLDQLGDGRPLLQREKDLLVQVGLGITRDRHVMDVTDGEAAALQHRADRQGRKASAVLAPVQPLLLDR